MNAMITIKWLGCMYMEECTLLKWKKCNDYNICISESLDTMNVSWNLESQRWFE